MLVRTLLRQVPKRLVPRQMLRDDIVADALAHQRQAFRGKSRGLGVNNIMIVKRKDTPDEATDRGKLWET